MSKVEKPDPKVPQLWLRERGSVLGFNSYIEVRIVYPNGYVECNTNVLPWDDSFMSSDSYEKSLATLKEYGHEFVFNIV